MNNLFKAALLPALTYAANRLSSESLSTSSGAYTGIDLTTGQAFGGTQGQLGSTGRSIKVAPSVEGNAPGTAGRWQANADVRVPLAAGRGGTSSAWQPYAGAGLCLVGGQETGETSKQVGLNLLAGVGLDLGAARAFAQARITVADGFHLSLTVGARSASH